MEDPTKPLFADLDQLLADLEAGKPLEVPPELRELAERVAQQHVERLKREQVHPPTEEELEQQIACMTRFIMEGPGD